MLGYHQLMRFLIHNIFYEKTTFTKIPHRKIQDAVTYIHNHIQEKITVKILAKQVCLSHTQFQKKFKEEMGMTPHAYITSYKIDTAQTLLKNPQYSITDIAYMLDFSSSNHFSNTFKKYFGITPTEFRAKLFGDKV